MTAIIEKFELVAGTDYSEKFGQHKIVTIEKLEDEVTDKDFFREKINPTTKALLMKGDKKVMFKTLVVPDNPEIVDVYV